MSPVYSLSVSHFLSPFISSTLPHVGSKLRFFSKGDKVAATAPTLTSSPLSIQRERVSAPSWKPQQILMTSQ